MTRHLTLVGHRKDGKLEIAVRCAWCKTWKSWDDAFRAMRGADVSDGLCPTCAEKWEQAPPLSAS